MIRFSVEEYVRNIGYNIVSILLLAVTFVTGIFFLSNISAQRRMTEFLSPYLDENSIIIGQLGYDMDVTELAKYEKSIMTRECFCFSDSLVDMSTCLVYDEYAMDKLTPRLIDGKYIHSSDSADGMMQVLVSENKYGVGVGDIIEVSFFSEEGAMEGRIVSIPAKVTGVIASGQKLMHGNGVSISKNMETKDIFGTYSYEQLKYSLIITTEEEFSKLPEKVVEQNYRCIIKFSEEITDEERKANYSKIMQYEREHWSTGTGVFPDAEVLVDRLDEAMKDLMIKYIPLVIAVFVLVSVCIMCMVYIKNANSRRYYAILYMCGMPYENAVVMSGIEMFINSLLAAVMAVTFVLIQNKHAILGEINCELGVMQILSIICISIIIVAWTMVTVRNTLREQSPISVFKMS